MSHVIAYQKNDDGMLIKLLVLSLNRYDGWPSVEVLNVKREYAGESAVHHVFPKNKTEIELAKKAVEIGALNPEEVPEPVWPGPDFEATDEQVEEVRRIIIEAHRRYWSIVPKNAKEGPLKLDYDWIEEELAESEIPYKWVFRSNFNGIELVQSEDQGKILYTFSIGTSFDGSASLRDWAEYWEDDDIEWQWVDHWSPEVVLKLQEARDEYFKNKQVAEAEAEKQQAREFADRLREKKN